jgi:hypothetical protein
MLEVATLALGAVGMVGGGVAAALAMCWIVYRLGKLTHHPVTCVLVACAAAVAALADAFSLGSFTRVSAAFALPILFFLWDNCRPTYRAPTPDPQVSVECRPTRSTRRTIFVYRRNS